MRPREGEYLVFEKTINSLVAKWKLSYMLYSFTCRASTIKLFVRFPDKFVGFADTKRQRRKLPTKSFVENSDKSVGKSEKKFFSTWFRSARTVFIIFGKICFFVKKCFFCKKCFFSNRHRHGLVITAEDSRPRSRRFEFRKCKTVG